MIVTGVLIRPESGSGERVYCHPFIPGNAYTVTRSPIQTCSHECEHGTQECVRHNLF